MYRLSDYSVNKFAMKLIKIEEVINGRTISRITDKSNDNGVNTESSIPSNIKGEDTKEENEVTVVETPKKPKKNELFPFGRKISFIILGVLIILSVSIAYLCTGYDYGFDRYTDSRRKWFRWEDFYLYLSILFSFGCILYGVAVWKRNATIKFVNTFKPQFGKGYNRLLTVSFVLIPWIIALIFYIVEGLDEFLFALLIVYAIECILYISILWVYKGFEEERKEKQTKENINDKTNKL